ncbi:hypothetical protein ACIP98_02610 [Streptomyces sp. NPDC088354]|uniref:hypothetical protein n=1 Tax=unclassified Streptomyces TaxID=2593676 RepID=UPI0029A43F14|nr:hypothetical protein [Streptomyces sp. MI02-7b]MDX3076020.1 hypothetical protein [Streptomyces sp. MI02-7b]
MSIRRRAAALGAVSLGLLALSACEKPTPLATVTVGGDTVTTEATADCYADGDKLSEKVFLACLNGTPKKTLTVHAGDKVRVGVDPAIGEKGWIVASGTSGKSGLLKDVTYRSFDAETLFSDAQTGQTADQITLNVIETAGTQQYLGVWQFKLKMAD